MMVKYTKILVILLIILFCIPRSVFPQKSGVIIGLRHDQILDQPLPYGEDVSASRFANYRTLWIFSNEQDSISSCKIQNFLLVPGKNTFWKIQVFRQKESDWVEDFIISNPIDQSTQLPFLDSLIVAECEGNKRLSIIFVGTDYLSYEGGSDGYCEGAAHPWHVNYLKTVSLDDPSGEGVDISAILGQDAKSALLQGARDYFTRKGDERLNPAPDEKNWGLIRRRGHWVLRGQLDYSSEVYRGQFAHFDIPFSTTQKLVGFDLLSVPWKKIKELVPKARDAITSPNKNLLIILTKDHLLVYSISLDSNLKLIQKTALIPNEFLIMAQWAIGEYVDKWNATIKDFLNR